MVSRIPGISHLLMQREYGQHQAGRQLTECVERVIHNNIMNKFYKRSEFFFVLPVSSYAFSQDRLYCQESEKNIIIYTLPSFQIESSILVQDIYKKMFISDSGHVVGVHANYLQIWKEEVINRGSVWNNWIVEQKLIINSVVLLDNQIFWVDEKSTGLFAYHLWTNEFSQVSKNDFFDNSVLNEASMYHQNSQYIVIARKFIGYTNIFVYDIEKQQETVFKPAPEVKQMTSMYLCDHTLYYAQIVVGKGGGHCLELMKMDLLSKKTTRVHRNFLMGGLEGFSNSLIYSYGSLILYDIDHNGTSSIFSYHTHLKEPKLVVSNIQRCSKSIFFEKEMMFISSCQPSEIGNFHYLFNLNQPFFEENNYAEARNTTEISFLRKIHIETIEDNNYGEFKFYNGRILSFSYNNESVCIRDYLHENDPKTDQGN